MVADIAAEIGIGIEVGVTTLKFMDGDGDQITGSMPVISIDVDGTHDHAVLVNVVQAKELIAALRSAVRRIEGKPALELV